MLASGKADGAELHVPVDVGRVGRVHGPVAGPSRRQPHRHHRETTREVVHQKALTDLHETEITAILN